MFFFLKKYCCLWGIDLNDGCGGGDGGGFLFFFLKECCWGGIDLNDGGGGGGGGKVRICIIFVGWEFF